MRLAVHLLLVGRGDGGLRRSGLRRPFRSLSGPLFGLTGGASEAPSMGFLHPDDEMTSDMWFAELEGIGVSRGAIEDLICGGVDVETVRRQDLDDEELGISTADADLIFAHVQARLKVPPIIFLDIDGVLNRTVHATHIRIDADLVSRLAAIVEASGARIVLTTFWREFDSYIAYILSRHGIDTKCVIGATTGRPTAVKDAVANPASRAFEIADFVRATGATRYVILDDRGDAANTPEQFERFVQTDASVGLTPEDVDRAIKILCGAEAEDAATSAALAVA